eukprot:UN10665
MRKRIKFHPGARPPGTFPFPVRCCKIFMKILGCLEAACRLPSGCLGDFATQNFTGSR